MGKNLGESLWEEGFFPGVGGNEQISSWWGVVSPSICPCRENPAYRKKSYVTGVMLMIP